MDPFFHEVAELARAGMHHITARTAMLVQGAGIKPYDKMLRSDLGRLMERVHHVQLGYLETGDLNEFRELISSYIKTRMASGQNANDLMTIGMLAYQSLEEHFKSELPLLKSVGGLPGDQALEAMLKRLKGLLMVAKAISANVTAGEILPQK